MTNIHLPDSEQSAAALVLDVLERGGSLDIRGGGTRQQAIASEVGECLSSKCMAGIVHYDPAEMVMTAMAGTTVSEIEAALAERSQAMAWEPMDHRKLLGTTGEPTIGGVFGANASGPRRFAAGASRDHLLGVRFVNGRGELVKAGGRVMKNVTGLDIGKLLAGSFGTLGFLTQLTFKVLPRPKASRTLCVLGLPDARASSLMAKAMALPLEITGAAHLPAGLASKPGDFQAGSVTALRIEGTADSVASRVERLSAFCRDHGRNGLLEGAESDALWAGIRDVLPFADQLDSVVWKISVGPVRGADLVARLRRTMEVDAYYDWQGGLVWLRHATSEDALSLRSFLSATGDHATLMRAPAEIRAQITLYHPSSGPVQILSRRIKQKFDPNGVFGSRLALGG